MLKATVDIKKFKSLRRAKIAAANALEEFLLHNRFDEATIKELKEESKE